MNWNDTTEDEKDEVAEIKAWALSLSVSELFGAMSFQFVEDGDCDDDNAAQGSPFHSSSFREDRNDKDGIKSAADIVTTTSHELFLLREIVRLRTPPSTPIHPRVSRLSGSSSIVGDRYECEEEKLWIDGGIFPLRGMSPRVFRFIERNSENRRVGEQLWSSGGVGGGDRIIGQEKKINAISVLSSLGLPPEIAAIVQDAALPKANSKAKARTESEDKRKKYEQRRLDQRQRTKQKCCRYDVIATSAPFVSHLLGLDTTSTTLSQAIADTRIIAMAHITYSYEWSNPSSPSLGISNRKTIGGHSSLRHPPSPISATMTICWTDDIRLPSSKNPVKNKHISTSSTTSALTPNSISPAIILDLLRIASRGRLFSIPLPLPLSSTHGPPLVSYPDEPFSMPWLDITGEYFSLPMYLASRFEVALWKAFHASRASHPHRQYYNRNRQQYHQNHCHNSNPTLEKCLASLSTCTISSIIQRSAFTTVRNVLIPLSDSLAKRRRTLEDATNEILHCQYQAAMIKSTLWNLLPTKRISQLPLLHHQKKLYHRRQRQRKGMDRGKLCCCHCCCTNVLTATDIHMKRDVIESKHVRNIKCLLHDIMSIPLIGIGTNIDSFRLQFMQSFNEILSNEMGNLVIKQAKGRCQNNVDLGKAMNLGVCISDDKKDGISTAGRSRRNNNNKKKKKKRKKKSSTSTFCSIKKDKNNECIGDSINIQNDRKTCIDIAKTPGQMNRYMVADNSYSSSSHENSDNERKSTNESSLCSSFISFNSNVTLEPQLKERNQTKIMILTILDKIVSKAMKVSRAKDLTIEKHDIINKPLNKNFHKSNRDNSFSTKLTCHDIPITSTKKIVCSNIIKGSNDHIILTKKGWEENDVIRNKEKQSTICNVEHNKKMSMIFMHSHKCKSNTNATSASTNILAINKSCYNKSIRIRDSTSDKELTYIECDNSFRSSSCFLGSARKSWSQIVLQSSLLPKNDFSIPPLSSSRLVPSTSNNRCYQKHNSNCLSTYNVSDKITSSLPPSKYHHSDSSRLEEGMEYLVRRGTRYDPFFLLKNPPMQIQNGEYDQASNDEICSDDNNNADPRQYIYEQQTKQGLIGDSNLSFQLGRSVYPHSRQTSLFSGLFVDEKDYPHCCPNHMKKEKKNINGNNNTNNSNNNGHEHGHGHGHGQGKEKEKGNDNDNENESSNSNISRHDYDNSNNDRKNSGNSNNNNNRNNSNTKDNTIILSTTVPIASSNPNPNKGISVEEEIEEERSKMEEFIQYIGTVAVVKSNEKNDGHGCDGENDEKSSDFRHTNDELSVESSEFIQIQSPRKLLLSPSTKKITKQDGLVQTSLADSPIPKIPSITLCAESLPNYPKRIRQTSLTSNLSREELLTSSLQEHCHMRRRGPLVGSRNLDTPSYRNKLKYSQKDTSISFDNMIEMNDSSIISSKQNKFTECRSVSSLNSSLRGVIDDIPDVFHSESASNAQKETCQWGVIPQQVRKEENNNNTTQDDIATISSLPAQHVIDEVTFLRKERNAYRDMCLTLSAENSKLKNQLAQERQQKVWNNGNMVQNNFICPEFMPSCYHRKFCAVAMSDTGNHHDTTISEDGTVQESTTDTSGMPCHVNTACHIRSSDASLDHLTVACHGTKQIGLDHMHGLQSRLTEDIKRFISVISIQLKKQEKKQQLAIKRLSRMVTLLWPRAQVKLYGSHATKPPLCLPTSDLDFIICLPAVHKNAPAVAPGILEGRNAIIESNQKFFARKLKSESWIDPRSIKIIEHTIVPVIKVSTKDTRSKSLQLDITFDAPEHHGLETVLVTSGIMQDFPLVHPLVLILKKFLLNRRLLTAYTGGLSSHCLFLMVTRYVQEQPKGGWLDCGSLLMGFLDFFGNSFDPRSTGISIRRHQYFSRHHYALQTVVHDQHVISHQLWNPSSKLSRLKKDNFGRKRYYSANSASNNCLINDHMPPDSSSLDKGNVPIPTARTFTFDPLFVEDPINCGNNIGRNSFRITSVKRAFSDAHRALQASLEWEDMSSLDFDGDVANYPLLKFLQENEDTFFVDDRR